MEREKRGADKCWNIVRIVFHMMRKNICKRKIVGHEAIHMVLKRGKAIMLHHHHHYSCRPSDINESFVSPREYEFSCSNTPICRSKNKSHNYQTEEVKVMRRVLKILEASPPPEQNQVDKDAEEFIDKFYKDLRKQKRLAALESPSPYHQFMAS